MPRIDEALRRGEVSYCQVRAMTRVATPQNEELLLVDAQHATTPQLEKIVRKYAAVQRGAAPTPEDDRERRRITRRDLDDGMVAITAMLHPEEAELLWAALTRIAREREPQDFSRIDALVEMASQVTRGGRPDRTPTDVVVTVPLDVLAGVPGDDLAAAVTPDGALLSMEAARRLACDAGLVLMVEDADGTCVSVGRKSRTIPAPMKRALLKRDGSCRFPGCCNTVFLDGHHVKHWANGGPTELANLVTLCTFHHRFLHEYGYRVELVAGQEPRFFDRDNRLVPEVVARPPMVEDGRAVVMRANAALSITATTGFPRWDGSAANYGWIIDDLCRADRLHDVSTEARLDPRHAGYK